MPTTTLSEKGQVVIPAEIRAKAGLRAGDRFSVELAHTGELIFRPLPRDPLLALRGKYKAPRRLTETLLEERRKERRDG